MHIIMRKRVTKEIRQIKENEEQHGFTCECDPLFPDSYTKLVATIPGPKDTPYEEGKFKLSITLNTLYPLRPPIFQFITPVFHPNINIDGKICLNLLNMPPEGAYNSCFSLESLLISIQLLLAAPNADEPFNYEAALLFKTEREEFNVKAKELVKKHCELVHPT